MKYVIIFSLVVFLLITSASAVEIKEAQTDEKVPFLIAFLAGIISVFSPCSVPLLLGYFALISKEKTGFWTKSLAFFIGLSVMWVLLGFSASGLGSFISQNVSLFHQIAGLMIMLFGILYLLEIQIPTINVSKKVDTTILGMFVFGALFTLAWIPCIGPILGSILMIAATGSSIEGGFLLFLYAAGFMLALIALFFLLGGGEKTVRLNRGITIRNRKFSLYNLIAGIFLIIVGLIYVFNQIELFLNILQPLSNMGLEIELIITNNPAAAGVVSLAIVLSSLLVFSKKVN